LIVLVSLLSLIVCAVSVSSIWATDDLNTALTIAARNRDFKTVQNLVKQGADPNAMGAAGMSSLMFAAMNGDTGMATFLVDHGALFKPPQYKTG
jgi:ankyrin repeat protein